jgi:PAS domain S-box-containing protein
VINANIPSIIWKADIDEQLNFTNSYISAEVDKYLGLPQGSIDNSCNKYFTYILPQYLPQIFDLFKKGLKHPNQLFSYDYEVQKADDKLAWFSTSGRVIIEDNKQTVYGSTIDITEQKKGEHALKEREEKLRNIFQNSTNLFYSHTPDHTLTYVSPQIENVLGYTQEEAMIKWTDLATDNPINQIGFQNTLKAINTGNRQPTYNLELIRKDGKKIIVEVRESPVIENDQVTSIVGSLTDVTDRIKAERELNKSRRRLKIMNSILRHDIMNDLVAMKSALKIYRHKKNEAILAEIEKRVKKGINTIKKQRKQQDFIDEYSMLDKMEMAKIASDVRKNHPEIKINIQGQGTAFADNAIYSVFDNLIANAIKHGKASTLDIDIEADENYCTMRIADNGIGIPDKYKDNVFEEGFQFGDSGNTGIGLFIVKQTIEGYDGEITVEDNQPQGTLFCIRLRRIIEK